MSFVQLIPVVLLFVVLIYFFFKKRVPGVSFSDLRNAKVNADVLDSIPLLILSVDRSGVILAVHSLPPEFAGEIDSECIGKNWCEFIHENFHTGFLKAIKSTSLSGDNNSFHYETWRESGVIHCEGNIAAISQDKLLVTVSDATDDWVVRNKIDLVNTSESITTYVLDADLMTFVFDRNEFLSKLSGRKIDREMKVRDIFSLFSEEQQQNLLNAVKGFLAGDADIHALKLKFNDTDNWIIVKGLVVSRSPAGKAVALIGTVRDVTESVAAENELLNLNLMLKNLLDRIPVGLYWKDVNLNYRGASRVFLDDTGVSSGE